MNAQIPVINSNFWQETARPEDPYCTDIARCCGYDVYGDVMGKAGYFEYLFLLFQQKRADAKQARMLEILAIALANPGPRDPSVHAAMAAGVSGTPQASVLFATLAAGAGSYGGGREVWLMSSQWQQRAQDLSIWCKLLREPPAPSREEVFPACEHPPGFSPYDRECGKPVLQTLALLATLSPNGALAWLQTHRLAMEEASGHPLAMSGIAACCLYELGFTPEQAEMLTLLLRLPGAAAHAMEQNRLGFRQFPFFDVDLQNDPGPVKEAP